MFYGQLRRERIAERMKALQELVPNGNKVFYLIRFQFFLYIKWIIWKLIHYSDEYAWSNIICIENITIYQRKLRFSK